MSKCPICNNIDTISVISIKKVPITVNTLYSDKKSALNIIKDDIDLCYCPICTHLFNSSFDLKKIKYGNFYENSLFFSKIYQEYAKKQIDQIINRNNIYQDLIIEIGSGRGDFIELLCKKTESYGIGYDPSITKKKSEDQRVTYVKDYFKNNLTKKFPDYIICRQTLEHIYNPRNFLLDIKKLLSKNNGTLFLEVPNALYIINNSNVWDLIYEHYSYFTPSSLRRLLIECGFEIMHQSEEFDGQYITVETKLGEGKNRSICSIYKEITEFSEKSSKKIRNYREKICKLKQERKKGVIWGVGSKGIMFLNLCDRNNFFQYAIDINPLKKGKYVSGTGQKILQPNSLKKLLPDIIFIMNKIYKKEIQNTLKSIDFDSNLFNV